MRHRILDVSAGVLICQILGYGAVWFLSLHRRCYERRDKSENPGRPAIFLGYAKNLVGYRSLEMRSRAIRELRTVRFIKDWTVERMSVETLILHRYRRGIFANPAKIPYVRVGNCVGPSIVISLDLPADMEHVDQRRCSND